LLFCHGSIVGIMPNEYESVRVTTLLIRVNSLRQLSGPETGAIIASFEALQSTERQASLYGCARVKRWMSISGCRR